MASTSALDPDLAEFDSDECDDSDDEFVEFNRHEKAGGSMIQRMVQNHETDLVESRRQYEELDFVDGNDVGAYRRSYIKNTVLNYFKLIEHDPAVCPSGMIIFCFISTIVRRLKPLHGNKPAPSLSSVQNLWRTTIDFLEFTYPRLRKHYTASDESKIKRFLEDQVRQKNLIKGQWQKKQWLGFHIVSKMVTQYLRSAVQNGCHNWDMVILYCLGVVLVMACCARGGDIARSKSAPKGICWMTWEDVELEVVPDDMGAMRKIRAKLTLRFTKNRKENHNEDLIVFFDTLEEAEHTCVCPIKILLVHALRHGLCYGNTIDEVLNHTMATPDKLIRWRRPEWPLLCNMDKTMRLIVDEPAGVGQISRGVRRMGIIAGILEPLTSRGIRNGAARDLAHLNTSFTGVANEGVALALGHSRNSLAGGTTQSYVGPTQEDLLNLRAKNAFVDRLAPKMQEMDDDDSLPHLRAARVNTRLIDHRLRREGMDPVDATQSQRLAIAKVIRQEKLQAQGVNKRMPQEAPLAVAKKRRTHESAGSSTTAVDQATTRSVRQPLKTLSASKINAPASLIDSGMSAKQTVTIKPLNDIDIDNLAETMESSDEEQGAEDVDESQLAALQDLVLCRTSSVKNTMQTDAVDSGTDDILEQQLFAEAICDQQSTEERGVLEDSDKPPWLRPGFAWVEYFAAINEFVTAKRLENMSFEEASMYFPVGNSRNTPTRFRRYCRKDCGRYFWIMATLTIHEIHCDGPVPESDVTEQFRCEEPECGKTFDKLKTLEAHQNRIHKWQPTKCQHGCDTEEADSPIFTTWVQYSEHVLWVHGRLDEPRECPLIDDCRTEITFWHIKTLTRHLSRAHLLDADQIASYLGETHHERRTSIVQAKLASKAISCPQEGCTQTDKFTAPSKLRNHFQKVHQFARDDATNRAEELLGPMKTGRSGVPDRARESNARSCPQEDCAQTDKFTAPSYLRDHLQKVHHFSEDDATKCAEELLGPLKRKKRGPAPG